MFTFGIPIAIGNASKTHKYKQYYFIENQPFYYRRDFAGRMYTVVYNNNNTYGYNNTI